MSNADSNRALSSRRTEALQADRKHRCNALTNATQTEAKQQK